MPWRPPAAGVQQFDLQRGPRRALLGGSKEDGPWPPETTTINEKTPEEETKWSTGRKETQTLDFGKERSRDHGSASREGFPGNPSWEGPTSEDGWFWPMLSLADVGLAIVGQAKVGFDQSWPSFAGDASWRTRICRKWLNTRGCSRSNDKATQELCHVRAPAADADQQPHDSLRFCKKNSEDSGATCKWMDNVQGFTDA